MSTWVPSGSDCAEQPLVSVLPPVPEPCAAWPRYVFVPSLNTKLAVHCAPCVNVWLPGCTVALSAGGHAPAVVAPMPSARSAVPRITATLRPIKVLPPAWKCPSERAPCPFPCRGVIPGGGGGYASDVAAT